MNATVIIAILIGICGVLFGVVCLKGKKVNSLKTETDSQEKTIKEAEKNIQEVKDVQKEIKQLDAEATPPEVVPPATTGDSGSRVERLNKLFNGQG